MAIVSCPECEKKLKVADTSVGKKVKCSCGAIFVAEEGASPVAAPPPAEKVLVACTECGAPLKVSAASLGKRVKCPKCSEAFVAAVEKAAPKPAAKKPAPPSEPEFGFQDDQEESPRPAKKRRDEDSDDDAPKARTKGRPKPRDDDEDDKPAAPPPQKSRLVLNLIVGLLVLSYAGFFAAVYFKQITLDLPHSGTGAFVPKKGGFVPPPEKKNEEEKKDGDDKKADEKKDEGNELPPTDIKKMGKGGGKKKKDVEPKKIDEPKEDKVDPETALLHRPRMIAWIEPSTRRQFAFHAESSGTAVPGDGTSQGRLPLGFLWNTGC